VLISECVCDEMGTWWDGTVMTSENNSCPARTEKRTETIDISWPG